jgi:PAS domain S-box-containing protein
VKFEVTLADRPAGIINHWSIILGFLALLGLYLMSLYSYLLFHSFAEVFSVVVACGIFVVAWNSRRFLENNYLLFLAIAYLFVALFDFIHMLAYTGMGVFPEYAADLPTQLWIVARFIESVSLLIAPLFLDRKLRLDLVFAAFSIISALILGSIFYWRVFPSCFVEGAGLTQFKITSEHVICFILLGSTVMLLRYRDRFDERILRLLVLSILFTIGSELAFTYYISAYGFSNLIGHFFKIVSFYLIYKAIIETGLREPYDLLFRELTKEQESLKQEADERTHSEALLKQRTHDLGQRVKELNCLYEMSRLVEKRDISLEKILQGTVNLIRLSWQYPEITCSRIILYGQEFTTGNFEQAVSKQSADIRVRGEINGSLEVGYLKVRPERDEGPFLKEERNLLNEVVERLGTIVETKRTEEALRKSEEWRSLAHDAARAGTWEWDLRTDENMWSDELWSLYGLEPHSCQPSFEAWSRSIHPDDREMAEQAVRDAAFKGAEMNAEWRTLSPVAGAHWVMARGRPVCDAKGKPIRYIGIVVDITERKRTEEILKAKSAELETTNRELASTLAMLEMLLDHAPIGICFYDPQLRYVRINPFLTAMNGVPAEDTIGRTVREVIPDIAPEVDTILRSIITSGQPVLDRKIRGVTQRTPKEQRNWLSSFFPIVSHEGDMVGVGTIVKDVSDMIRTQEELSNRNIKLRTLGQLSEMALSDGSLERLYEEMVHTISLGTGFPFVAIEEYDQAREKMIFKTTKGIPLLQGRGTLEVDADKTMSGTVARTGEAMVETSALNRREYSDEFLRSLAIQTFVCVPMILKEHVVGTVSLASPEQLIIEDDFVEWLKTVVNLVGSVIEKKEADERIKSSLKEKEVLLREIHHRVKNNLAIIDSLLVIQSDYTSDQGLRTVFRTTRKRVKSMAVAHEMLYQSEDQTNLDLKDYIGSLVDHLSLSSGIGTGGIEVATEIDEIRLGLDTAIPLGFIVTELVTNSLKHAFPQHRDGRINVSLGFIGEDELELTVADNGIGMHPDLDLKKSSSLGLHLLNLFVRQLRGQLFVESGRGTEVRIRFRELQQKRPWR